MAVQFFVDENINWNIGNFIHRQMEAMRLCKTDFIITYSCDDSKELYSELFLLEYFVGETYATPRNENFANWASVITLIGFRTVEEPERFIEVYEMSEGLYE